MKKIMMIVIILLVGVIPIKAQESDQLILMGSSGYQERAGYLRMIADLADSNAFLSMTYGWNHYNSGVALLGAGVSPLQLWGWSFHAGIEAGTFVYGDEHDDFWSGKVWYKETERISIEDGRNILCLSMWVGISVEYQGAIMQAEARKYYQHYGEWSEIGQTDYIISWDVLFSIGRRIL